MKHELDLQDIAPAGWFDSKGNPLRRQGWIRPNPMKLKNGRVINLRGSGPKLGGGPLTNKMLMDAIEILSGPADPPNPMGFIECLSPRDRAIWNKLEKIWLRDAARKAAWKWWCRASESIVVLVLMGIALMIVMGRL